MPNYNSRLQSNNETLNSNNFDLQNLIDKANSLPDAGTEQATPEISVDSSGLITAVAGSKSSAHQLAFQPAKTITPSTMSQIAVSSGYYTGGDIIVEVVPTQNKMAMPTSTSQNITPDTGMFLAKVTVEGDSNLIAENIKSGVSIFGVNGTLEEGGGVESNEIEDIFVNRSFGSIYTNSRVTNIGAYAFTGCSTLISVDFPAVRSIRAAAFSSCTKLVSISFPSLISMNDTYTFQYCSSLESIYFPACTTICTGAFYSCSKLTTASFPAASTIGNQTFTRCTRLSQLYLTGSFVCKLANSNTFSSTPFAGYSSYFSGTPYIYVPSSLIASYQTATNWTYFSSYFSVYEASTTIITFTINGISYEATEGMTWIEWVESDFNTNGYYIEDDMVYDRDGLSYIAGITGDSLIVDGKQYTCYS